MTSLKNKFREEFLESFKEELFKEDRIEETWIKQNCANFTMIPFGLEELGRMVEVSTFTRGEDIITQYMIESDHSYVFAKLDEGETTWKLLSRIPDEIIRQIDYLAWEEADIAIS